VTKVSAEPVHELQPCDLAHVVLEIHQKISEPSGIIASVEPTDERGAFGIGSF
jgi:hypothetical protein